MASSRWKRFAFFDRKNLSLPNPVYEDILSPSSSSSPPSSSSLSLSSNIPTKSSKHDNPNNLNDPSAISENVSIAIINGAGIPYASLQDKNHVSETSNPKYGVLGMANTLEACNHNATIDISNLDGTNDTNANNDSEKDAYKFSSTGRILSLPLPSSSTSSHPKNVHGNINGSLVLAFVSSKFTNRIHCIDLTVRCNPIHLSSSFSSSSSSVTERGINDNNGNNTDGQLLLQQKQGMMENLDGWRGYFVPFVYDNIPPPPPPPSSSMNNNHDETIQSQQPTTSTSSSSSIHEKKIMNMAICSDHNESIHNIKSGKNIYVACITNVPHSVCVTVHRNPHLYLNDNLQSLKNDDNNSSNSSNNKTIRATPKVEVYQPNHEFDLKQYGQPVCVEISYKSGIVAVGTDCGKVLLYSFYTSQLNSSSRGSGGSGAVDQSLGNRNGTKKLNLVMEIPVPPTAGINAPTAVGDGETRRNNGNVNSNDLEVSCLKCIHEPLDSTDDDIVGGSNNNATKQPPNHQGLKTKLFVTYRRRNSSAGTNNNERHGSTKALSTATSHNSINKSSNSGSIGSASGGGVCCYDLGVTGSMIVMKSTSQSTPAARYDLDGREVVSSSLCDMVISNAGATNMGKMVTGDRFMIARSDGLYTYSSTDKITVSPIDGNKIAMCSIPPPSFSKRDYNIDMINSALQPSSQQENDEEMKTKDSENIIYMQAAANDAGASYALIATTDTKSGRDAVDIYDASNKLVAFHILLSPGHKALRAAGITTSKRTVSDGTTRGGLSSAIVITTGGSLVTLTEKITSDKVALLIQKNLYSAAISMAFADSSYKALDITSLFRRHAEHLYRKGDFVNAMDQYIHTIGSLEPSHVIFRFLDAPKIPLLAKYLEELRSRNFASSAHCELLKTCYLKLNDVNMAEKTSSLLSKSLTSSTCTSLVSNLLHNPSEALATICSFEAPYAVEALKIHGSILARASPRETAGIVISLCDGVYSPNALASFGERRKVTSDVLKELLESKDRQQICEKYPVHLFSTAFMENPKLLRVILAHCLKNKLYLTPSLKRTLLQLTLEEWNAATRVQNKSLETIRRDEAMSILSDPQSSERLGDYESLVIVQQHDFVEGEILLYERLQMIPLLVEKYANEGTYKARRQMLALCRSDPEILGDVLGCFVAMTTEKLSRRDDDNASVDSESELGELLQDVREALQMARSQKVLSEVACVRILGGEGVGQFRNEYSQHESVANDGGVPLSVAMDYIGSILDEKNTEIERLQSDVEEYNYMCNVMETEISELLSATKNKATHSASKKAEYPVDIDIDEMYTTLMESTYDTKSTNEKKSELSTEEFWRAMGQSDDRFSVISKFFAKDIIN